MTHRLAGLFLLPATLGLAFLSGASADEPQAPGAASAPAGDPGIAFEPGSPPWADVLAKAKAEQRPVFVDFSTAWCGWCKRLDKDTFSQASVARAMKAFVCVHVDAEKGEGVALAKRYRALGFPTLVVVDAAGDEVDRIVGYRKPDDFLREIDRIEHGKGTLPALKKKAQESPQDLGAVLAYAEKLVEADPAAAAKALYAVAETLVSKDPEVEARKWLVLAEAVEGSEKPESALSSYAKVTMQFAGTKAATDALRRGGSLSFAVETDRAEYFFREARRAAKTDKDRALVDGMTFELHMQLAAKALKSQADAQGDDAQALNSAAWTAYELRHNFAFARLLYDAARWAQKAVEISKREPAMLDTLASIKAATGKLDEAIALEEEALPKADNDSLKADLSNHLAAWKQARDERKAKAAAPPTPPTIPTTPAAPAAPAAPVPPAPSKPQ